MARGERVKAQGKSRNRRDTILDEATRLFAERGFEGTSMSDLAEQVGLRKASLFHHFASKEELRRAVLDRVIARATAKLSDAMTPDGDGDGTAFAKRVDAITDALIGLLAEQPYTARLVLREAMEWDSSCKGTLGEAFTHSLDIGHRFLSAAQRAGVCLEDDPKQLVTTLVGMHLVPFALGGVMERFMGAAPWSESFVNARRSAMRAHVRALLMAAPVSRADA
jgi:AcrR family transcriptional regulator